MNIHYRGKVINCLMIIRQSVVKCLSMKKKLLIFDLDGTLINTLEDLNHATNVGLEKYGYPVRSVEQARNDIGNGVKKLIERSIPGGIDNPDYLKVFNEFRSYYISHYFDYSKPYQNTQETLSFLKKQGYKLAVVSNKFDEGAKKLVTTFFPDIFDVIQGSIESLNYKPHPDLVNKVLKELNIESKDALYIGDTEVDYQTAINSSLEVALVTYGYRTKEQLLKKIKNPPVFIDDLSGLINLLSK